MVTWKFKKCPRCEGDIYTDWDLTSWYEQCLQCGYLREVPGTVKMKQTGQVKKRVPAVIQMGH